VLASQALVPAVLVAAAARGVIPVLLLAAIRMGEAAATDEDGEGDGGGRSNREADRLRA
jgi:hypothetical protein